MNIKEDDAIIRRLPLDDAIIRRLPEEESVEPYFGLGWSVFEEMVLEAYKEAMS